MLAGRMTSSFLDLVQCAQHQLQWWNQLVCTSSSTLNPQKCCCMIYSWTPAKLGILWPSNLPLEAATISVDSQQPPKHIKVLVFHGGTRYLGIYVTQNCMTKPMENHIWNKAVLYTKVFWCTHMSHCKVSVLYLFLFSPGTYLLFPSCLAPSSISCAYSLTFDLNYPQ